MFPLIKTAEYAPTVLKIVELTWLALDYFHTTKMYKLIEKWKTYKYVTAGKKTLFRNGDARANGRRHENR